ncbi:MAG: rRNA methyltransferase [Flavobacteriales bacterium]|nr:hypothetical protein [Flavobacteriales bacterium]MCB9448643.1 rRNA methyltransferase [Flavobacteriales bacterium]
MWPELFTERMQAQLGQEYPGFQHALQQPPPVSLRLNGAKVSHASALEEVPWCIGGYYLPERPVFALDPWWHAGAYFVQEASSMLLDAVVRQLSGTMPLRVLDLCAAPGGKTTLLASALPEGSVLVANEVIRSRVTILKENVIRWGTGNVVVTQNDPEVFERLPAYFDGIVVDAPCSGEGLFRKDEAAAGEWSERNLALCAARQARILESVTQSLKPGGWMVYSTCTFNPEENDQQIAKWVDTGWETVALHIDSVCGFVSTGYGYQAYPHRVKGEGFYLAVLRKPDAEEKTFREPKHAWVKGKGPWGDSLNAGWTCRQWRNAEFLFPETVEAVLPGLEEKLHVVYAGVEAGILKGKDAIPAQPLAMMTDASGLPWPAWDLTPEEALTYLRKDVLPPDASHTGWAHITCKGLGLGWAKVLPNRVNNAYPVAWRLRMAGDPAQVI